MTPAEPIPKATLSGNAVGHAAAIKRELDAHLVPLLAEKPALNLHAVPFFAAHDQEPILVWLLAREPDGWPGAVKRLLDAGFQFDYLRDHKVVDFAPGSRWVLFGGDGLPFIGANGMAMVRLYRRVPSGPELIVEVGYRYDPPAQAAHAVKTLLDLIGGVEGISRHRPPFGAG